jgi:hypothetical protein
MNATPSWMGHAWSHWHRPWSVMHAAWHETAAQAPGALADDWMLRLHYPAWCEQHGLATVLQGFEDNAWWQLLGLSAGPFEQAVRRAGLVLMFAADARTRLQGRPADDVAVVRWALGRTPFVPRAVVEAVRKARLPSTAASHAALSLHWCLADLPELQARLRLRFPPSELQPAEKSGLRPQPATCAWLATLWNGAVRATHKESSS